MKNNERTKASKGKLGPEIIQEIIETSLALDEEALLEAQAKRYKWLARLFNPSLSGAEKVPEGPVLFISNHSTWALDAVVAFSVMPHHLGRFVRQMNGQEFYLNPRIRETVLNSGGVTGDHEVGAALFEAGKDILLFPGGGYEAAKSEHERYTLKWKERTGFVRMAAKHGVPIVPMGIVGPDEFYSHYLTGSEIKDSVVGKLLIKAGVSEAMLNSDIMPPIPKGMLGTFFPKPHPVYFEIADPVDTSAYQGKKMSQTQLRKVRAQVEERLNAAIAQGLVKSSQGKEDRGILRKLLSV